MFITTVRSICACSRMSTAQLQCGISADSCAHTDSTSAHRQKVTGTATLRGMILPGGFMPAQLCCDTFSSTSDGCNDCHDQITPTAKQQHCLANWVLHALRGAAALCKTQPDAIKVNFQAAGCNGCHQQGATPATKDTVLLHWHLVTGRQQHSATWPQTSRWMMFANCAKAVDCQPGICRDHKRPQHIMC
jgi:hypothetical protein